MKIEIFENFPEIYRKLLPPTIFSGMIDPEKTADCRSCIMCEKNSNIKSVEVKYFSPDTKCCTYHPALPNYLVGALLCDKSGHFEEGKKRIRTRIENRNSIIPSGVWVPEKFIYLYKAAVDYEQSFGKTNSLMCPYLDKGNCSIWKYRNAICSTWFCKSDNGEDGMEFWEAVKDYIGLVEKNLIKYLLFTSGFQKAQIISSEKKQKGLSPQMLDERPLDEAKYNTVWGKWTGKEEEFYIHCFKKVEKLNSISLEKIMGIKGEVLLKEVKQKHKILHLKYIPNTLKRNATIHLHKIDHATQKCLITLADKPYYLPVLLYNSLVFFDGKKINTRVLPEIRKKLNLDISNDLLLHLYRNRLLTS